MFYVFIYMSLQAPGYEMPPPPAAEAADSAAAAPAEEVGGNHWSNTTRLPQVLFKSDKEINHGGPRYDEKRIT